MTFIIIQTDLEPAAKAKRGRQIGSTTKFPGSVIYARQAEVTPTHLYRVLMGVRSSQRLVLGYADFLRRQGVQWPASAKVKPHAA